MDNLSKDDRNVHLKAVIKSNLVGFNIESDLITQITENLTTDILDVLDNFDTLNSTEEE